MNQSVTWQAWGAGEAITFAPASKIEALRADGTISATDSLLHEIVASTGEDAMAQHHKKMGWAPYCLLYTSPSPRDQRGSRMPSSA